MRKDTPETLKTLIKDIRFAMLTTRGDDGSLRSRPMTTQAPDADDTLWFFCHRSTHAAGDITAQPQINLSYSDAASHRYVSISGHAEVVEDRIRMRELWHPEYVEWFPQGLADPDLALVRITVERADYWQSPATWFGRTLAFARSLVTGEPAAVPPSGPVTIPPGGSTRTGRVNWTVLLWALGVPLPIVLLVALFRGCS